ncbi:MAG: hypothetical protein LBL52_00505 [Rickettsiales bacterium]|jgi:hypothetical protein|nr:hypothetical protein [Rickettsiales bacterium]
MSKNNHIAGAVLMQVLFGLGLMIAMTPVILKEIRKYNEQIAREEVVAQMDLAAKTASSFMSFEKGSFPVGCREYNGNAMRSILDNYGGRELALVNRFGQEHFFIACKRDTGEITYENGQPKPVYAMEAVAGAQGGDVDEIILGSIGGYMFDKGAVIDSEGNAISNYAVPLSESMKLELKSHKNSLIMYVGDASSYSEFLHIDAMNTGDADGIIVNTMLADIDMRFNDMLDIHDLKANQVDVAKVLRAGDMAGVAAVFGQGLDIGGTLALQGEATFPDGDMPIAAGELELDSAAFSGDVEVKRIDMAGGDLYAGSLKADNIEVSGDMQIADSSTGFPMSYLSAESITATSWDRNIFDEIVLVDDNSSSDSRVIAGRFEDGKFVPLESASISLSGVSEVVDICKRGGGCISDAILGIHADLLELQNYFSEVLSAIEAKQAAGGGQ